MIYACPCCGILYWNKSADRCVTPQCQAEPRDDLIKLNIVLNAEKQTYELKEQQHDIDE